MEICSTLEVRKSIAIDLEGLVLRVLKAEVGEVAKLEEEEAEGGGDGSLGPLARCNGEERLRRRFSIEGLRDVGSEETSLCC